MAPPSPGLIPQSPGHIEVHAERWFDGTAWHDEAILLTVAGETIGEVALGAAAHRPPAPGATRLEGGTLLPGLVNVHAHAARAGGFEMDEGPMPLVVARALAAVVQAGVTTMADMGAPAALAQSLRQHTAREASAGPSLRVAGPIITAPEGYPLDWMPGPVAALGTAYGISTEDEARRRVSRLAAAGVDHVKLAVMHRSYRDTDLTALDTRVGAAAVAEAHAQGLRAYAHAHARLDYQCAIDMGVDALVHSSFDPLDDETVRRVADAGVAVCPTLWVFESLCLGVDGQWSCDPARMAPLPRPLQKSFRRFEEAWAASGDVVPEGIGVGLRKARLQEAVRQAAANLRLLRDAGVPIAFGTDAPYGWDLMSRPADELYAMHRAGLDRLDVLRAATSDAAGLLALGDRGRIASGLRADLVLVDGDPTVELEAIERVQAVVRGGVLVGDAAPWRTARAFIGGLGATVGAVVRERMGG